MLDSLVDVIDDRNFSCNRDDDDYDDDVCGSDLYSVSGSGEKFPKVGTGLSV